MLFTMRELKMIISEKRKKGNNERRRYEVES